MRRRRIRMIVALVLLVLLSGIGYGIHYASYLPQFTIQDVDVRGSVHVPAELIETYVESELDNGSYHFLARDNIFLYPRSVLEKGIVGSFPRIKSAEIARESVLANSIVVTVSERQPYARWCSDMACYLMDDTGFVFSPVEDISAADTSSIPIATGFVFRGDIASTTPIGKIFEGGRLPGILAYLKLLQNSGYTPLGVTVIDSSDFNILLSESFFIKSSFGGNPDVLVRNLQLILNSDALRGKESELEYVDLRFGNRVYYKLKGTEQTQAR